MELKEWVLSKFNESFSLRGDGALKYQGSLFVPDVYGLRDPIIVEAHGSRYSIHQGTTKMHHDLREIYWWEGLKRDIEKFVVKCQNCQYVKVKDLKLGGLLQEIQIPT